MEHVPTTESDIEKVYRIARELGIGLEEAAITCDAFDLAFSDDRMRRAIFEIIDQLDESAAKKGEPFGLIINYTVELGMDGIRVGRYADEIPAGEIVELTPSHRASIYLKINDNFPTQEFLGPLIVNRPGWHFDTFDPHAEIREDLSHLEPTGEPICLGPIRLKFAERFSFIASAVSPAQLPVSRSPLCADDHSAFGTPLSLSLSHYEQFASGLSPPPAVGECAHSDRKMFHRHWH